MSLKTICLSKAYRHYHCADNDAKSMVKHLIFLRKFAVINIMNRSCRKEKSIFKMFNIQYSIFNYLNSSVKCREESRYGVGAASIPKWFERGTYTVRELLADFAFFGLQQFKFVPARPARSTLFMIYMPTSSAVYPTLTHLVLKSLHYLSFMRNTF